MKDEKTREVYLEQVAKELYRTQGAAGSCILAFYPQGPHTQVCTAIAVPTEMRGKLPSILRDTALEIEKTNLMAGVKTEEIQTDGPAFVTRMETKKITDW